MRNSKLPESPATTNDPSQQHGTAFRTPTTRRWQIGTVVSHSPATQSYIVRTQHNGEQRNVPRLCRDPGEIVVLPAETVVALHDELGFLVIDSVIKLAPVNPVESGHVRVTEARGVGGEDPVYQGDLNDVNYRAPNDPIDVLSGDWVRRSGAGNLMGVLEGGTNVMKSSPFAQVRTNQVGDLVEIISYVYRHISSMGNLEIKNDGGKTSLIWRAGSDQTSENGSNAENWTIWLDMGAEGDLFNLRVTTPEGHTLCQVHMGSDGKISVTGTKGIDMTTGGTYREDVGGDKNVSIQGNENKSVKQDVNEDFAANQNTSISKNKASTVGGNQSETISGDRQVFVGGDTTDKHMGEYKVEVINGGVEMVVGNPLSGGLPKGQDFDFVSYTGPINMVLQPTSIAGGGAFNVMSALPKTVNLGVDGIAIPNPATGKHTVVPLPAIFSAAKFEPLMAVLLAMLAWMDAHTHLCAVGPTLPAALAPTGPVTPIAAPLIPLIMSLRVGIGL